MMRHKKTVFLRILVYSQGPLFPPEHELSLRAEGLTKPRRKRGRPPKSSQPPTTTTSEVVQNTINEEKIEEIEETTEDGKRKRRIKKPTRFSEGIQGKELDKVFKQTGILDEESISDVEDSVEEEEAENPSKAEVIGRLETENGEDLGQPVVIKKSLRKTRTKNKNNKSVGIGGQTKRRRKYQCEICGREFLHHGRYEVHKKMHEVKYNCTQKNCDFVTDNKEAMEEHQQETGHSVHTVSEKVNKYVSSSRFWLRLEGPPFFCLFQ